LTYIQYGACFQYRLSMAGVSPCPASRGDLKITDSDPFDLVGLGSGQMR
jgi:hypothetical protein